MSLKTRTVTDRALAGRYSRAIHWASKAFSGRFYEGPAGPEPYVLHSIRVAERVPMMDRVVGVLHDVLEDTDAGLPGFLSDTEREALELLTKDPKERYIEDYIERIRRAKGLTGGIARRVKMADLTENLSNCGSDSPRRTRYEVAISLLSATPGRLRDTTH